MRLLAFSDTYIPSPIMELGLSSLSGMGVEIEVRRWEHPTLIAFQQANLAVEKGGPEAVKLPSEITGNVAGFEILVVQFTPIAQVPRGGVEPEGDRSAAWRHGERRCAVCHRAGDRRPERPGRNARAVAEYTMGMILSEIRNIARAHGRLKCGEWRRSFPNSNAIPELYEKTVGLVGFGAVGRLVAGYLAAFGSRVVAYDPYFQGDAGSVTLVNLETLLGQSDVVSIHARLSDETHHLIGEKELGLMKRSAVLVNTARSGLIDERALVRALRERRIWARRSTCSTPSRSRPITS